MFLKNVVNPHPPKWGGFEIPLLPSAARTFSESHFAPRTIIRKPSPKIGGGRGGRLEETPGGTPGAPPRGGGGSLPGSGKGTFLPRLFAACGRAARGSAGVFYEKHALMREDL